MKEHAALIGETAPPKKDDKDKKDKKEKKGGAVMEDVGKEGKLDPTLNRVKRQMAAKLEN